jgi:organic radical activating enzyme
MMKITKVELLWSRGCPFACTGCSMPDALRGGGLKTPNGGTLEDWYRGIEQMVMLGSQFVAIYGAEPLTRMEQLPEVIDWIHHVGMGSTLITALPRSQKLKDILAASTLDSVTCSYDGLYGDHGTGEFLDSHRKAKSVAGQRFLQDHQQIRDRACVATVSRENADQIVQMARAVTNDDMWFLWDLYHSGTGPLSKCGNDDGQDHSPTREQVVEICTELLKLKRAGKKIHASEHYMEFLIANYKGHVRSTWHCRGETVGWLTVDADGSILACDDWQKAYPGGKIWDDFDHDDLAKWVTCAREDCVGCTWSTHKDAIDIESGLIQLGSYVHE